jgi:hypothetical protein
MKGSLGHRLAVAIALVAGVGTMVAEHLIRNPDLVMLGLIVLVASCAYLFFEQRFSK